MFVDERFLKKILITYDHFRIYLVDLIEMSVAIKIKELLLRVLINGKNMSLLTDVFVIIVVGTPYWICFKLIQILEK